MISLLLLTLALLARPWGELHLFAYLAGFEPLLIAIALFTLVERRIPLSLPEIRAPRGMPVLFSVAGMLLICLLPMRRIAAPPEGAGDSLWLVEILPLAAELTGYWTSFDEILEPLLRSLSYRLFSYLSGSLLLSGRYDDIFLALGLYSYVCGFLLLASVVLFLRKRPLRTQIRGFLLLFCVPTTQLFAGYIEHYAFLAMSVTVILLMIAVDTGLKRSAIIPYAVAFLSALAALHHLSSGLLLPGLIYYIWLRNDSVAGFVRESFYCGLITAAVLLSGWFLYFNILNLSLEGSHLLHPPILPLHKIFSSMNLVKVLFVLLLCAPAASLLARLWPHRLDNTERIVAVVAATYGLQLFIWNPVIGMPADWDLLGVVAIPLHVLLFLRLEKQPDAAGLGSLAAVTLLPTLLWLSYNHRDDRQQAIQALDTARSVVVTLQENARWPKVAEDRKRELMLLYLLAEKRKDGLAEAHRLLDRALSAPNEPSYRAAIIEVHRFLGRQATVD